MKRLSELVNRWGFIIHPILFALFPLLSFYGANASEIRSGDFSLGTFVLFSLIVATIAWTGSLLLMRSPKKASILALAVLAVFFAFGRVHNFAQGQFLDTTGWVFGLTKILLLGSALFVGLVWLWTRKLAPKSVTKVNATLTLISVVLVASALLTIVPAYLSVGDISSERDGKGGVIIDIKKVGQSRPDIYYILLDGYARADYLKENFNLDNSGFINSLKERGFYVADQANSNYAHTHFSVPSTFNMKYLNYLADELGEESVDRTPLKQLTRNNDIVPIFQSLGYKYVNIGTHWDWTQTSPLDDPGIKTSANYSSEMFGINLDEFAQVYLQTTALKPWITSGIKGNLVDRVLNAFKGAKEVASIEQSTLTFAHIVSPHPPYLFDRNGVVTGHTELELLNEGFSKADKFADQTVYVNKLMLDLVDKIQKDSDEPPIIIIASDHGPASTLKKNDFRVTDPSKFNEEGIKERMGILNAYYFPDGNYEKLYPSISPVNSFRVVLNLYFGQDLELLPDRSYFSDNKANEYRMFDVTDLITAGE